ncbi:MAG: translation elongation factor Ts [Candidatus Omnitrophica bacterium]|nr:translation elongation factor Ts [Candidatus Omnitrophota bacterium]
MTVKENVDQVRDLRNETGAGIMDCKRALVEANGNLQTAKDLLRKRGFEIARKKSGRDVKEGQIFSYIHLGGKIGVLVEVNCETDFVARNSEFQQFGRDVAMQIAAAHPFFVSREEVDPQWVESEKEVFRSQVKGKPAKIQDQIVQGKLEKRFEEVCLLDQKFIKDEDQKVQDLLTNLISKLGERVVIKRFRRFEIGRE